MTKKLRAVGSHIFAGGFTLGVSRVFDVEAVFEKDRYGVATAELNMPNIRHVVGYDKWPAELDRLKPEKFDLAYGNPPCAAWSVAGATFTKKRDWRNDDRVECVGHHWELLTELRPTFWAWESVQRAWFAGRELVDSYALKARDMGYSVTIVLHDAQNVGVPQRRQRFFFIAHKIGFDPIRPDADGVSKTLDEALRELNDPGEPLEKNITKHRAILDQMKQGENLKGLWERLNPPETWKRYTVGTGTERVAGRPPFTIKRAKSGQPSPVVMHEIVHPTEQRGLSIKELAYLCGFPAMYEFVGASDAGQVGRGVCPPVGEWLARSVARDIARNVEIPEPTYTLRDYTDRHNLRVERLEWPVINLMRRLKDAVEATEDDGFRGDDGGPPMSHLDYTESEVVKVPTIDEELGAAEQDELTIQPPIASSSEEEVLATQYRGDVKPKPGLKSGAYIRLLLTMGRETTEIVDAVHRHYPDSKATAADVSYQRRKVKQEVLEKQREAVETGKVGEVQALRTGPRLSVDPTREFDKTSLREGAHGQWVHRDYAAHFFRWSFAGRFSGADVKILDIGCGPDVPMINALTMPRANVPKRYVGVDMNREPRKAPTRQWAELKWEFNFLERYTELGEFDLIVSFEVIEHMRKPDGERFLAAIAECLQDEDSRAIISTPVFNGKAAANHLHEWTIPELAMSIEAAGLEVVDRFGTFASWNDIKKAAKPEEVELAKRLSRWYDGEVMSCFLAPLYPDAARNNCWVLKKSS